MTHQTPDALDRLWEDIPTGQPPIADLLATGRAATRRRRRATIAGVAAATLLILGAGILGAQAFGDHRDPSGLVADGTGADTRLVGLGHVAIAVPASWAD